MDGVQEEVRIAESADEVDRDAVDGVAQDPADGTAGEPADKATGDPADGAAGDPADDAVGTPVDAAAREPAIRLDSERVHRFLVGFLIAAAAFFVEAGVAEIALARNSECVRSLSGLRLAPNPDEACMSELGRYVAQSVSRAGFGADTPQALVWLLLAAGYGLLGGAFSQLRLQIAVAGYLIVHALLLAGFTSIAFLSQFIA